MNSLIGALGVHLAKSLATMVAALSKSRNPYIARFLMRSFLKFYKVDLSEAEHNNIHQYASFHDFFSRRLKTGSRALKNLDPKQLWAAADGTLNILRAQSNGTKLDIKQQLYSTPDLLQDPASAQRMATGAEVCIYLAPHNYHRVHMPASGRLIKCRYIKGALFPVNQLATHYVPKLLSRNERLVCHFQAQDYEFAVVFVAAFLVGGIYTPWHQEAMNETQAANIERNAKHQPESYELTQGQTLGYFSFGSTAVVLSSKALTTTDAIADNPCVVGQSLGSW